MEFNQRDDGIRRTILLEYYARLKNQSKNPEMHFFNIPELKETDKKIITKNALYLIDENFVRGGVDVEGDNEFPWISRILPKGIEFVEKLG